ncbi:hypothetical protein [Paenibacillus sp. DMB20]|uniref:hypothetical protein n=1 Tax=Paenibacillus sp. DMB20 TaxID=1642570 RepID=UPI000627C994|nr:hypothetical protein [Paenibacillus sp. DMB20]KKO55516.1 hypothetical protein XI25_00115 [Paenibacillus sp. DMB20]
MSLITVWSPLPGGTGSTALAASLPVVLAAEFKVKCLLLHGGKAGERVEQAYSLRKEPLDHSIATFQDEGMSALERLAASGRLTPDNLRDYTIPLLPDKLDLLSAHPNPWAMGDDRRCRLLDQIIRTASRSYDVIVADAGNGFPNAADRKLLGSSKLVLFGLTQNLRSLEGCFEQKAITEMNIREETVGYVVGRYDRNSHCTLQNMKRRFGLKGMLEGVPYCTEIANAWNSRNLQSCILRARGGGDRRRVTPYVQAVRNIAFAAAERLGLPAASGFTERGA